MHKHIVYKEFISLDQSQTETDKTMKTTRKTLSQTRSSNGKKWKRD